MSSDLARFGDVTRAWFAESFEAPTRVQALGWAKIAEGAHTLMLAPTGSGKTLAAFLWALDRLIETPRQTAGYRVVYISPLKALAYDVEKNLTAPLVGLRRVAARLGLAMPEVRVDVRTGDTPAKERRRQGKEPGDILITTPESLYLLLGSHAREGLRAVETVIVDEIHAVAPTKRGAHLALCLERLSFLHEPQRIGLSATQKPLELVARFLGGDRPVEVVDAGQKPNLDLQIVVPVADMSKPEPRPDEGGPLGGKLPPSERNSLWPAIYPALLDLVVAHRSTILFVNSRRLAERLSQQLSELAIARGDVKPGEELVRAHHGSVARHEREAIEDALKSGRLRAITATSSLELGIDMGAVDLVVQIESPGAVARGLQRIGRAGHHVGGTPKGRIVPKFRGDLLEAAVVARGMLDGDVEPIRLPENCLDVLAQQIVAMCAVEAWRVDDLERVVKRAAGYANLTRGALTSVLDMLSGRYPSDEFAELRPRLTWDRHADTLTARRGARLIAVVNAGTIPDRGLYAVHLGPNGPRVGELDEEMVHESRAGETFLLGATTWRIEEITRDRVIVSPAPGEPGKMPFWRGEGPGRPIELGMALGALCRTLDLLTPADGVALLQDKHKLDALAAGNLVQYIADQRAAAGAVPTDAAITVERFRDEIGDWRVCILSPLGSRVHAPWALVLQRQLEDRLGYPVHPLYTDDGIALRFADGDDVPGDHDLFPDPDVVEEVLVAELTRSAVFAGRFRENAARALLLPRRRPGQRTPLWSQRLRAQQLLGVALRYPSFPIVLETYREVLRDVFDVPALVELLRKVRGRAVRVDGAVTETASPFARSLVFEYVAAYLYEGDAPLAERRAQALTLDRTLLRELLGDGELRDLLDPEVLAEVEAELQARAEERRARHADHLNDLLLRIGDLSSAEIAQRAAEDPAPWLDALARAKRIVGVRIAGDDRWIAVEDAARYRDALGTILPPGLPAALLEPAVDPIASLIARYARTHGPFTAHEVAARFGLPVGQVQLGLGAIATLESGGFRPGGGGLEHCDVEVLRQIRRRTLARLRREVSAVPAATYARFLGHWHQLGAQRRGLGALREALAQLEGVPLPFSELEARVLPARVVDFTPRLLDELGAMGELVWVGHGSLGASDGRVILCRRDRAASLLAVGALADDATTDVHRAIVAHLRTTGASFLVAIEQAAGDRGAVKAALWDLVWAGVVTNDTFAPLRSLGAPKGRRVNPSASFGGRWSLVETLLQARITETQRAHARAVALLDRWGVVSREAASVDDVPGGFTAVVDVLRAMEDAGKVRRGYFVDGLAGSQYAWPGAIDRLRATRDDVTPVVVVAATDPANPWGATLPWPQTTAEAARPARRVGALVVLVDGACVLHVEPRGKRLITFAGVPDDALVRALAEGLAGVAATTRRRTLTIETIDGEPAIGSPITLRLEAGGARKDYRGLVIEPRAVRAAAPAPEPEAEAEAEEGELLGGADAYDDDDAGG